MASGAPTGLTLMPTTSPGSNNDRHASTGSSMPVRAAIPVLTIALTASASGTPDGHEPGFWTSTTRPGNRPGNGTGSVFLAILAFFTSSYARDSATGPRAARPV